MEPQLGLVDSNVLVYALVKDYPSAEVHAKSLELIEKGLKGQLGRTLCLSPIVVVEAFFAITRLLDLAQAEFRILSFLKSNRIGYLTASRSASMKAVTWAKEAAVPLNDAVMAAIAVENSALLYTADYEHFSKLKKYGVAFSDPTTA